MAYFENCVSLGSWCGTAGSLGKQGLRSFTGPFDWIWSDFDSVIKQIDDEFADFMKRENLEISGKNSVFIDKKYNFLFIHDVKENFNLEYAAIYDKYLRRTQRFLQKIKKPTCFFRAVRSGKEVDYIINNVDYIESVIKRYNSRNTIVYILLEGMSALPDNLKSFRLATKYYEPLCTPAGTTIMFDSSKELEQFCKSLLPPEQIQLNRKIFLQHHSQSIAAFKTGSYLFSDVDGIDKQISEIFNLRKDDAFYIWGGGGDLGLRLYRYLIKRNANMKAIIDKRPKSEFPPNMRIITPGEIEPHSKIFIAISDEAVHSEIKEQVKDKCCSFCTFNDLAPILDL